MTGCKVNPFWPGVCVKGTKYCDVQHFAVCEGAIAYLRHPVEVIRRTKEGRLLCRIYDREVSIPETMLHNKDGMRYIDERRAKALRVIHDV